MKFKTLTGSTKRVTNIKKHLIKWDKKSRSKFQFNVKKFLEPFWGNHIVFEEFPIVGTRMSLDFYNANKKIAVEVQGGQHTKYVPHFHGNYKNNYIAQLNRDHQKFDFCELNDIILVEIYPEDEINKKTFEKYEVYL
jgi:hypothetical protein